MTLPTFVIDILRLVIWLLLILAMFVPLERLCAARPQRVVRGLFLTDLGYYFLGNLVPKLMLVVPLSLLAWTAHRAFLSPYYLAVSHLPLSLRLAAAMVVGEAGYYWAHRMMHEVPWMWRFHAIHHSAEEMDFLVNVRAHPIDGFLGRLGGLAPLYVLGLAQPMGSHLDIVPLLFAVIGTLWGFFIHANVTWRFGWLERVVATPAFHHWHHTNDGVAVRGKNYASMLPLMDLCFGSYYVPTALPVSYGIDEAMPRDLAGQLLHPWAGAIDLP